MAEDAAELWERKRSPKTKKPGVKASGFYIG
jgi:hypothetical protein